MSDELEALRAAHDQLRADFEKTRRLIYDAGPRLGKVEREHQQLDRKFAALERKVEAVAFAGAYSEAVEKAARAAAWELVRDHPTSGVHPGIDPADGKFEPDPNATATVDEATLTLAFQAFAKKLFQGAA